MTEEEVCRAGRQGLVDPPDPRLTAALEQRARTGTVQCELRHIRKNGARFTAEVSSVLLKEEKWAFVIVRDITERKEAENALRESEEKYRSFFENGFDAVFLLAPEGCGEILSASAEACRMCGYTEEEFRKVGRSGIVDTTDPRGRRFLEQRAATVKARGEIIQIRKDGTRFPADVSSTVFKDKDGRNLCITIIRDVTHRKHLEATLRLANEQLEKRVEERTAELKAKTVNLEEMNTALKVLLDRGQEDRKELEEATAGNLKSLILPYIKKLRKTRLSADQAAYLSILQSHLAEIESRFVKRLSLQYLGLTPTEIQVAVLIRDGKTTKEIAEVLHVSEKAIAFHRDNIRQKLSLRNKKENLSSHLIALA